MFFQPSRFNAPKARGQACSNAYYIIQRLDTGEFVGSDDGEMVYYISLSKARLFQSLQNALDYARDIDPSLMDVTVHTVYQPCNYQSAIL